MTDNRDVPQDDDTQPIDSSFFSPAPQPRNEWASASWTAPTNHPTTPERWFEPASQQAPAASAALAAPAAPAAQGQRPARSGAGVGTVLAAATLAAVLASGGTFAALTATGALD